MAKQIIENGKYNLANCPNCGCKFSFDGTDLNANLNVTCPQCDTEITVEKR